jgi:LysM repeat protein
MDRNNVRPMTRGLVAACGALLLLAACSSGGGSSGATTTTASTSFSTIPIPTTAPPASGGTAPGQSGGAAGPSGASGATGPTYTVQSGDYPIGIAKKLGVSLQALLDANGMSVDNFNLVPGMKLKVPSASSSSTTVAGASGSTPGTTAAGGTTVPPTTTTLPGTGGTYTVQPNDYWAGIAQKLGVDASALAAFNDKSLSSVLHPGDQLKVPPKSTPTTVKPATSRPTAIR